MKPELLAPAGSPEALRAAVLSGADAVYLGWGEFNARRGAKNFSDEAFADALSFCRERGVRVYLTLNTLLTDRELPLALELARRASALGVDAVLVQDLGLLELLRRCLPDLPLHASTQLSIFTSGGVRTAAALGCRRVVVARECSGADLADLCRAPAAEIEVFVHGALCMCYSGQCALSALIGGRSGNRGLCAQPCRLPYGVDGPARANYPLSLKDCSLADNLDALETLGVSCLKLEGRMKRPEYVAVVTRIYTRLLAQRRGPTPEEAAALEQAFSRSGFTDAYWRGTPGPEMFGVRPENAPEPKELFARAITACEKEPLGLIPADFVLSVRAGVPCMLTVRDGEGREASVFGPVPEPARTRAVTEEELAQRLQKTGGTAYVCREVFVSAEPGLSLSAAAVNALRRDALAALSALRLAVSERRSLPEPRLPKAAGAFSAPPALTVSLASRDQLSAGLLEEPPARICLPLEWFAAPLALPDCGTEWCAILPRVWRERDEPRLKELLSAARRQGASSLLLGNLGQLPLTRDGDWNRYGDFGLNVFNSRALDVLRGEGLSAAAVSFELRFSQIRDLTKVLPTEALVYGRLPLMITENCLVRNALGCGADRQRPELPGATPCREPHALWDRTGARFPLLPAWGHRTELENSRPLYLADREDWKSLGLAFARLRFTTESPEDCVRLLRAYRLGAPTPESFTRGLYDRGVE